MLAMATKKKPGRSREKGVTTTFTFEMSPELDAALEACCQAERRTKRAIVTIALEQYLQAAGFWPRPDSEGD